MAWVILWPEAWGCEQIHWKLFWKQSSLNLRVFVCACVCAGVCVFHPYLRIFPPQLLESGREGVGEKEENNNNKQTWGERHIDWLPRGSNLKPRYTPLTGNWSHDLLVQGPLLLTAEPPQPGQVFPYTLETKESSSSCALFTLAAGAFLLDCSFHEVWASYTPSASETLGRMVEPRRVFNLFFYSEKWKPNWPTVVVDSFSFKMLKFRDIHAEALRNCR